MIAIDDKQFETTSSIAEENAFTVIADNPAMTFDFLKEGVHDIFIEMDDGTQAGFSTEDYSNITITEKDSKTTITFVYVNELQALKDQISALQKQVSGLDQQVSSVTNTLKGGML